MATAVCNCWTKVVNPAQPNNKDFRPLSLCSRWLARIRLFQRFFPVYFKIKDAHGQGDCSGVTAV